MKRGIPILTRALVAYCLFSAFTTSFQAFAKPTEDCLKRLAALGPGNGWFSIKDLALSQMGEDVHLFGNWECPSCARENSFKPMMESGEVDCPGCGSAPQEKVKSILKTHHGEPMTRASSVAMTKDEIAAVKSGLKWKCASCGCLNRADHERCTRCNQVIEEGQRLRIETERRELTDEELGIKPKLDGTTKHGDSLPYWAKDYREKFRGLEKLSPKSRAALISSVVGGSGALAMVLYWLFDDKSLEGHVAETRWEHVKKIQRFSLVTDSGWLDDIRPSDPIMPRNGSGERAGVFNIRNHTERIHHYDKVFDHMETYTETVPHSVPRTEYYTDTELVENGNGGYTSRSVQRSRTVYDTEYRQELRQRPVYRDEPRYATWVTYDTYRWVTIDTRRESGVNPDGKLARLPWPEIRPSELGEHDRVVPSASYSATIEYQWGKETRNHTEVLGSESDYLTWMRDQPARITYDRAHGVQKVERLTAEKADGE